MSRKRGEFESWAREQFGPRPSTKTLSRLYRDACSLKRAAILAENIFKRTADYDDRLNAALYGWQAGPGRKP